MYHIYLSISIYIFIYLVSADPKSTAEDAKTLSESAAEYTESHTNKRKYDEVTVFTGKKFGMRMRMRMRM